MKYQDTIKQANNFLSLSIKQLEAWSLAPSPINYAVSYEFVSDNNKALSTAIKYQLSTGKTLDNFYMDAVYQQFILGQSKFRDDILVDLDQLLVTVEQSSNQSTSSVSNFISALDININELKSNNEEKISTAYNNISTASLKFKTQQQELNEQLNKCQQQSKNLQKELDEIRDEIYLDPLTGLHNRKAMSKHIETWYTKNPNKNVAAIVINVNHYSQVTQRFGSLIGDVLLSKIASKIESYVDDCGLPVRTGGNEFLILLPDIDVDTASEIGEKIRQGVGKLRFVSSKSGIRLPQMTVSVGVNQFKVSQNVNAVIDKTRRTII